MSEPKSPRERSGLPAKFTDRECAAYVWLLDRGVMCWVADLLDKTVHTGRGETYASLIAFAQHHGWEG